MYFKLIYKDGNIYIKKVLGLLVMFNNLELGIWQNKRNNKVLYSNVPINNKRLQKYLNYVSI